MASTWSFDRPRFYALAVHALDGTRFELPGIETWSFSKRDDGSPGTFTIRVPLQSDYGTIETTGYAKTEAYASIAAPMDLIAFYAQRLSVGPRPKVAFESETPSIRPPNWNAAKWGDDNAATVRALGTADCVFIGFVDGVRMGGSPGQATYLTINGSDLTKIFTVNDVGVPDSAPQTNTSDAKAAGATTTPATSPIVAPIVNPNGPGGRALLCAQRLTFQHASDRSDLMNPAITQDSLIALLLDATRSQRLSISAVRSDHGPDSVRGHSGGYAADCYPIDASGAFLSPSDPKFQAFLSNAASSGSLLQIGLGGDANTPANAAAAGSSFFADNSQDHVHLGARGDGAPAAVAPPASNPSSGSGGLGGLGGQTFFWLQNIALSRQNSGATFLTKLLDLLCTKDVRALNDLTTGDAKTQALNLIKTSPGAAAAYAAYGFPWRNFIRTDALDPNYYHLTQTAYPAYTPQAGAVWATVMEIRNSPISRLFVTELGQLIFDDSLFAWTGIYSQDQTPNRLPAYPYASAQTGASIVTTTIGPEDLRDFEFGFDDNQLVTFLSILPNTTTMGNTAVTFGKGGYIEGSGFVNGLMEADNADSAHVNKLGYRYGQYESQFDLTFPDAIKRRKVLLVNHNSLNTASITVRGNTAYRVGARVLLSITTPRAPTSNKVWYIEAVSHQGTWGEDWTTSLELRYPTAPVAA